MSEVEFQPFQKVLVRDNDVERWQIELFERYREGNDYPYDCLANSYKQCIPYEGNEHLLGTTDSSTPPEPEFRFGDKVEVSNNNTDWHKAIYYAACKNKVSNLIALKEDLGLIGWKFCRHADW